MWFIKVWLQVYISLKTAADLRPIVSGAGFDRGS